MGSVRVGKTYLLTHFADPIAPKQLPHTYEPTIGADLAINSVNVGDKIIECRLWELSSGAKAEYEWMVAQDYKDCDYAIFIYNSADRGSFDAVKDFFKKVKKDEDARGSCQYILLAVTGPSKDEKHTEVVAESEGNTLAETLSKKLVGRTMSFKTIELSKNADLKERHEQVKQVKQLISNIVYENPIFQVDLAVAKAIDKYKNIRASRYSFFIFERYSRTRNKHLNDLKAIIGSSDSPWQGNDLKATIGPSDSPRQGDDNGPLNKLPANNILNKIKRIQELKKQVHEDHMQNSGWATLGITKSALEQVLDNLLVELNKNPLIQSKCPESQGVAEPPEGRDDNKYASRGAGWCCIS